MAKQKTEEKTISNLSEKPKTEQLSDEELARVVGGAIKGDKADVKTGVANIN